MQHTENEKVQKQETDKLHEKTRTREAASKQESKKEVISARKERREDEQSTKEIVATEGENGKREKGKDNNIERKRIKRFSRDKRNDYKEPLTNK